MAKIETLAEDVYRKIAAGEVVERPLSVVKELVENSLDANADSITINVADGGKKLIEVIDNGDGFAADDIETAFKRHSTSKLRSIEDLNSLTTLGFRGEALPSILEVSEIELVTSDKKTGSGHQYFFSQGKVIRKQAIAFQQGTRITVKDLFYNLPVRQKFLKSERTELNRVTAFAEQLAMVNYFVSFTLTNNSRVVFSFNKANSLEERIYQIFGKDFLENLMPLEFDQFPYSIQGYVSRINTGVSSKKHQYYFVNKRAVREGTLFAAFNNSFQKYLEKSRFPAGVLLLTIPPDEIDVNIHPMKLEIKFERSEKIYQFIKNSVNSCFKPGDAGLEPTGLIGTASVIDGPIQNTIEPGQGHMAQPSLLQEVFLPEQGFSLIGQYQNSYIIIEKEGELHLVDQHNAHERVNFDRLKTGYQDGSVNTVSPLFPIIIELTPSEIQLFDQEKQNFLKKSGFDLEPLSNNSFDVKAYPQVLHEKEVKATITSLLSLEPGAQDPEDRLLAEVACKSAIKVNTRLVPEEMTRIVTGLFASSNPYFCPHKRPILVKFSLFDLEKLFKRK